MAGRRKRDVSASRETTAQLLARHGPEEFLESLAAQMDWQGLQDYDEMPEIGQLVCCIYEFWVAMQGEGFEHYLIYAGSRWKTLPNFLAEIGAFEQAQLVESAILVFTEKSSSDGVSSRVEMLNRLSTETEFVASVEALHQAWMHSKEQIERLLKDYAGGHADELESLLVSRATARVPPGHLVDLSDDELVRMAHRQGNCSGLEGVLVASSRLPVLLTIACGPSGSAASSALRLLYASVGNVGAQMLGEGEPRDLAQVLGSIELAQSSPNKEVREWSDKAAKFLAAPDGGTAVQWMGLVFPS